MPKSTGIALGLTAARNLDATARRHDERSRAAARRGDTAKAAEYTARANSARRDAQWYRDQSTAAV